MSGDEDEYEVGYGKPPKKNRFQKGQSGNKKGRPKGRKNFNTDLEEVLGAPVTVTENGRPKKVSTQMALLLLRRENALKGDARAGEKTLEQARQLSEEKADRSADRKILANEDAILERYLARIIHQTSAVSIRRGGSSGLTAAF